MKSGLIGLIVFGLSVLPSNVLADNPSIPYSLLPKVDEQNYIGESEGYGFCAKFYKKDGREIGFFYSKVSSECGEKPTSVWIDSNNDGEPNEGEIFEIDYRSSNKNFV